MLLLHLISTCYELNRLWRVPKLSSHLVLLLSFLMKCRSESIMKYRYKSLKLTPERIMLLVLSSWLFMFQGGLQVTASQFILGNIGFVFTTIWSPKKSHQSRFVVRPLYLHTIECSALISLTMWAWNDALQLRWISVQHDSYNMSQSKEPACLRKWLGSWKESEQKLLCAVVWHAFVTCQVI